MAYIVLSVLFLGKLKKFGDGGGGGGHKEREFVVLRFLH
jgi:hypothetical protein